MSKKKDKKAKKANKAQNAFANFNAAGFNAANAAPGWLGNWGQWLQKHPSEQFLAGAALGAAAAYVLCNEELRGKLLKGGMSLYAGIAGQFAELREQIGDIQAEMQSQAEGGMASAEG
jgi:hypothetical protein